MKPNTIRCLLFATISAISSPCQAIESIGWNYDGLGDDTLATEDAAGATIYEQTHWNNHAGQGQGPGPVPLALSDNTGASSGTSVTAWTLTMNNSWRYGESANPNQKLLNSFSNRQPAITFSNIPASYVASGYSVVVYYGNNEGPSTSSLVVTGSIDDSASRSIRTGTAAQASHSAVGFVEETGALAGPTNYTVITGMNDPQVTVALTGVNNNGICAIQLVKESGAPSVPLNPSPSDFSGDLATSISFDWKDSLRATSYQIFVWKNGQAEPATPTATSTTSSYDPPVDLDPSSDYNWRVKAVGAGGTTPGPVWVFGTGTLEAPGAADFPFPDSGDTGVSVNIALEWDLSPRAASYQVFLWKSTDTQPTTPTAVTATSIYSPPAPLEGGVTYQWRVNSVNATGTTPGPLWNFTTGSLPSIASAPSPANGATGSKRIVTLDWADSTNVVNYKIYLWPASESAPAAPLATVTSSTFALPSLLLPQTAYHWRIDATNGFGTATGPVWSFSTTAVISDQTSIGWAYNMLVGTPLLATEEVAGIPGFQQAFWNTQQGFTLDSDYGQGPGTVPFALSDSQGSATTVSLSAWTLVNANGWHYEQSLTPNEKLVNSFTNTQPSLTFSGLPAAYTDGGYSVIVYYGNNEGPATSGLALTGSIDDAGSRNIITGNTAQASYRSVGFVEEAGALAGPTNYTIFTGLNDPSFTVSMTGANNNGISAVQIVKSGTAPPADAFASWASTHGLTGAAAGFTADPDNDGISNGVEFVIGGEPNPANAGSNSSALLPTTSVSGTNLVFTFKRRTEAAYLNPAVEFSTTLQGAWTTAVAPTNATITVTPGTPADTVTVTVPRGSNTKMFARLKVTKP